MFEKPLKLWLKGFDALMRCTPPTPQTYQCRGISQKCHGNTSYFRVTGRNVPRLQLTSKTSFNAKTTSLSKTDGLEKF